MNSIGDNNYKLILLGVIAVLLIADNIFTWIGKHPATTVVLLCAVGFIAYLIYTKDDKTPPPTNNNSSPY